MKTQIKYSLLACCTALVFAGAPTVFAHGDDESDMFMKMDTDGDGYVSRAEANAAGETKFARADVNHDGMVTVAELQADKMANGGDSDRKHSKMAKMEVSDWVAKADTDGDGKLTLAEASTAGNAMFDKMDTNSDGKISKDECKTFHKNKKTERNDSPTPNQQ